jgi:hypothetical protein
MSKSTLSITVPHNYRSVHPPYIDVQNTRAIEVPCRLPEALTFKVVVPDLKGVQDVTFWLKDGHLALDEFECHSAVVAEDEQAILDAAESILATIKADLATPNSAIFTAIALAYEAECAAYDACVKAHAELPRILHGDAMYFADPRTDGGRAERMLAKYVEHVVENACKAQTERAESKVTP